MSDAERLASDAALKDAEPSDAAPGGDGDVEEASPKEEPSPARAPRDRDKEEPSSSKSASITDDPLRMIQWLAILGVVALFLGRFVAPALPGSGVGVGGILRGFELSGAILSQLFAIACIVGISTALIHTANTTIPAWLRLVAMLVATHTSLVVLGGATAIDRSAQTPALLASLGAGTFSILAAFSSRGARVTRLAALALGLVGASVVVRALSGLIVLHATKRISMPSLITISRSGATIGMILVGAAAALAIVYIGRTSGAEAEPGPDARPSFWSPVTIVVLVLAIVCARQAIVGSSPEAGSASVLIKRAADRFLVGAEPHLRLPVRLFLGFLTPFVAAALLTVRRLRTLAAALCLLMIAADTPSAPLGSLTLVVASLGVLLVARSGHVLWSALIARPPASPPRS